MIIAFDSSTLILLQKIKLLDLIVQRNQVIVSGGVYKETILKGLEKNYLDAIELNEKIKNNLIRVIKITNQNKLEEIQKNFNLARGEAETIILHEQEKTDLIALDDLKALKYCDYYKILFITAINFVINYYKQKLINKNEALDMIKNLAKFGRYKEGIIFYALEIVGGKNE